MTRVTLTESSPIAVTHILQYIYTSDISLDTKSIQEILVCSQELELTKLIELCEDFLINLNNDYIFQVLEISKVRKLNKVYNHALRYVCDNLNDLVRLRFFLKISNEILMDVLQNAPLNDRNEKLLFERILKWTKLNFKQKNENVHQVLKLLDFSKIDNKWMDTIMLKFESVLNLHDCSEVLKGKIK